MSRRPAVTATQAAATKAEAAADALLAWMQTQPMRTASHREATDAATERGEPLTPLTGRPVTALRADVVGPDPLVAAATQTEQPDLGSAAAAAPSQDPIRSERGSALRLDHTDWLHHRLLITGPVADLVCLRAAACGAGTVPWHLDFDRMEEDLFHLLVAPPARAGELSSHSRSLSLAGARIPAGQLRVAAARRHALAIAGVAIARPVRSTCTPLCRCPMLSSGAALMIRMRWTGFGRTGGPRRRCNAAACGGREGGVGIDLLVCRLDAVAGAGAGRRALADAAV
jgi:hypothetical protein